MTRPWILALSLVLTAAVVATAEEKVLTDREKNLAAVETIHRQNQEAYKGNAEIQVLPGVLADRKAGRVVAYAEATKLRKGDICEFFLVGQSSGHDYESLGILLAKPSDVHKALEFVGLPPGRPYDADKLQFWPKGERVFVTFAEVTTNKASTGTRVERFVDDDRTGKTLPEGGFVFTGSAMVSLPEKPETMAYAADVRGPNSLISDYNEPQTVLDVPRQAPQAAVYQRFLVSEAFQCPSNSLVEVVLEPEYKDGKRRAVDAVLAVTPRSDKPAGTIGDMAFLLTTGDGKTLGDGATLKSAFGEVAGLVDAGHDPFVTLTFHSNLTVRALGDLCVLLASVDTEKGMRIEPPRPGHLYYKAFTPDPTFLDRQNRIAQPWELILATNQTGVVEGTLTKIDQVWKDDEVRPDLQTTQFGVPTPDAFVKVLTEQGPGIPVILVFAQPVVTHGQLMAFLEPIKLKYPTIHVFVDEKPVAFESTARPAPKAP